MNWSNICFSGTTPPLTTVKVNFNLNHIKEKEKPTFLRTSLYQLVKMFQTASQSQKWSLSTLASCQVSNGAPRDRICSQVLGRRVCERRTSCDRDQPPPPSTQPTVCNATATTTNQPHNQNTNWTVLQLDIFGFLYFDQTSSNPLPPSAQPNQSFATANRKHHQPTNKQGKNKQKSVRPKLYHFFYFFQV